MKLIWHFKSFNDLSPFELYEILRLRNEVFIIEQNCIYNECDNKDLESYHLWCSLEGKIIGYCRLVPPEVSYSEPSFGRIVSHPDYRNLKLGHLMLGFVNQIVKNYYKTSSIRISAQVYLRNFYESYGFRQVSEEYLEDNLPHMEMLK